MTINGTAGNGFLSLSLQSTAPSAVVNTIRIFNDSSNRFSYVVRNIANSADITRTFIMPDSSVSYTFPSNTSTLAGLEIIQTFTAKQIFSPTSTNSGINVGSFAGDPSSVNNGDI
jgi:hypothetical protein